MMGISLITSMIYLSDLGCGDTLGSLLCFYLRPMHEVPGTDIDKFSVKVCLNRRLQKSRDISVLSNGPD